MEPKEKLIWITSRAVRITSVQIPNLLMHQASPRQTAKAFPSNSKHKGAKAVNLDLKHWSRVGRVYDSQNNAGRRNIATDYSGCSATPNPKPSSTRGPERKIPEFPKSTVPLMVGLAPAHRPVVERSQSPFRTNGAISHFKTRRSETVKGMV